ncbi:MAG TPA: hypothetical protein VGK67_39700 [Myxococcales bacterium]|jgi:hypothetical protein
MTDDRDTRDAPPTDLAEKKPTAVAEKGELPVVARLIVEIRSDGTQTIARGALEDSLQGVKVGIEAHGSTPVDLAVTLAKSMFKLPVLRGADKHLGSLRSRVRALLPGKKSKG